MTQSSFDAVPFALAELDPSRRVLTTNQAWTRLFCPREPQVGRRFDDIISARDAAGRRAYVRAIASAQAEGFSIYASLDVDGAPILSYLRVRPGANGWLVFGEPVVEGSTHADLLFERERWRAVLHSATEGIAIIDKQGHFSVVNARFLELAKPHADGGALLDDQGIAGWRYPDVLAQPLADAIARALSAGAKRSAHIEQVTVGAVHLELRVSSASLPGGLFAGTCITVHDRSVDHQLVEANRELKNGIAFLEELYGILPGILLLADKGGAVARVNDAAKSTLGYGEPELLGSPVTRLFDPGEALIGDLEHRRGDGEPVRREATLLSSSGERIPALVSVAQAPSMTVYIAIDIREQKRLELQLRQSQKLESVGRMAAGVAHEINTPVQFVSDSLHFLRDATNDLLDVVSSHQALAAAVAEGRPVEAAVEEAKAAAERADLAYLVENVPKAFERSLEGLARVTKIVRSMKDFAHPDSKEMSAVDLNAAIESTLVIATNEYKQVATVETHFDPLPPVTCHAGEINQVILNIIVNAAHAIGDVVKDSGDKGLITVCTRADGDYVTVSISDTGCGIPAGIRHRVFDPFFTTKPVGKGTGQGLALARSVVVDLHHGELSAESEVGKGTTLVMRLPVSGKRTSAPVGAPG